MLNENTCSLIDTYMKYSNKNNLTVEEFLMFRKQVVEEQSSGVKYNSTTSSCIKEAAAEIKNKDSCVNNRNLIPIKNENKQSKPNTSLEHDRVTSCSINTVENNSSNINNTDAMEIANNNSDRFNDDIFLQMMKSIED